MSSLRIREATVVAVAFAVVVVIALVTLIGIPPGGSSTKPAVSLPGQVASSATQVVSPPTASAANSPAQARQAEIAYVDGSLVRLAGADGSHVRTVFDFGKRRAIAIGWSPGGERLAARADDGTMVVLDDKGHVESRSQDWTHNGSPVRDDGPITFSADGNWLVFVAKRTYATSPHSVAVVRVDGSGFTFGRGDDHTDVAHPMWSPDGRWIAYLARIRTSWDLFIAPIPASGQIDTPISPVQPILKLDTDPAFGGPVWSAAAGKLRLAAIEGHDGDTANVLMVDLGSGGSKAVVTPATIGFWPSWSSDGTQLGWLGDGTTKAVNAQSLVDGGWQIKALQHAPNVCDSLPKLAGTAICATAAWSPDGAAIAGPDFAGHSIVIVATDGSTGPVAIPLIDNTSGNDVPRLAGVAWRPLAP